MGFFDRLLGRKPAAPAAALDTSEANLRAVFGDDNVMIASGLWLDPVVWSERPAPGGDQVGGIPDNIGAEMWPNCRLCSCPMTFIAQIAIEPDREPRYPERGYLAIFLCNSDPPTSDDVCVTAEGPGSACFFVGEDQRAATPMFDDDQLRAIARAHDRVGGRLAGTEYLMPQRPGWNARPVLQHAFRVERRRVLSVRKPDPPTDAGRRRSRSDPSSEQHYALWAAACDAAEVAIDIGGFPDWLQSPIELTCRCGAPMELILQYDAFDGAINLGDTGRAYVFACAQRCSPTAFAARWDCC